MSGKHIFISYIEENRDIAEKIWDKLTEKGYIPWAYTKNDSSKWKKQIVRELQQCDIMILVFSKKTDEKANKQVVKELGLASEYEKEIIPFMLDDITPKDIKNEEIAYEIIGANITWINKEESLNKQIDILLNRIEKFYGDNDILGENNLFADNDNIKLNANEDPGYKNTLMVTISNRSQDWSKKIKLLPNDTLVFQIHYYAWHEGAINLRVQIENLSNKTFAKNDSITVKAKVYADNLAPAYGEVELFSEQYIKLEFGGVIWRKNFCMTNECNTPLLEDENNIFSLNGLNLGNIPKQNESDYFGNILVYYHVLPLN